MKKRLNGWGLFFLRNIWWIQEKALPLYLVTKNIHKPTNIEFYMKRILKIKMEIYETFTKILLL